MFPACYFCNEVTGTGVISSWKIHPCSSLSITKLDRTNFVCMESSDTGPVNDKSPIKSTRKKPTMKKQPIFTFRKPSKKKADGSSKEFLKGI